MMQAGQPFNRFLLFTGIFIPGGLVRANGISPGAKLAYRRLARYAGQDGECYRRCLVRADCSVSADGCFVQWQSKNT